MTKAQEQPEEEKKVQVDNARTRVLRDFVKAGQRSKAVHHLNEHYQILHALCDGPVSTEKQRAILLMNVIEAIGEKSRKDAVNILADGYATYQLARHGQAKAVLNFLSTCTKPQQAKVLAADEALFGLLEYLPKSEFKQLKALYDALPQAARKNIEHQPKKGIAQGRNGYLAQHYGLVASTYKGRKSATVAAKPAPVVAEGLSLAAPA